MEGQVQSSNSQKDMDGFALCFLLGGEDRPFCLNKKQTQGVSTRRALFGTWTCLPFHELLVILVVSALSWQM